MFASADFVGKPFMFTPCEWIDQAIGRILIPRHFEGMNESFFLLLPHEMIANINVFGLAVDNTVLAGLDRCLVVDAKSDRLELSIGPPVGCG